jgi:creatinine amidohydrolase
MTSREAVAPGARRHSAPSGCSDIFADTIAEMTWVEVDRAAHEGAVLLWGFGVIEQHGPHLPAGTDVYLPAARLRAVRRGLAERDIQALIVPPYYWGINVVSGGFPASYGIRPEIMRELMVDVFAGMSREGFRQVFCFSGHGDASHNQTIHGGVRLGRERTGMDISFVADEALAQRIGLRLDDPCLTISEGGSMPAAPGLSAGAQLPPVAPAGYIDVHAGRWETSMMMHLHPDLVREQERVGLAPTEYGPDDLAVWRRGFDEARRKTPLGYFGDPAAATAEAGAETLAESVCRAVDAIEHRLRGSGA